METHTPNGRIWILIGADSLPMHIAGMRLLLAGLLSRGALTDKTRLAVGVPREAETRLTRLLTPVRVRVHAIDRPPRNDRFFGKIVMIRKFLDQAADHDTVLYLDYDHLCLKPLLFECADELVGVGSESISTVAPIAPRVTLACSTSLILGRAKTLCRVAALWESAYDALLDIHERHREELAFALAAQRAGVPLHPVPPSLQSSWVDPHLNSSLFHYGGEMRLASDAKESLARASLGDGSSLRDDIAAETSFRCHLLGDVDAGR